MAVDAKRRAPLRNNQRGYGYGHCVESSHAGNQIRLEEARGYTRAGKGVKSEYLRLRRIPASHYFLKANRCTKIDKTNVRAAPFLSYAYTSGERTSSRTKTFLLFFFVFCCAAYPARACFLLTLPSCVGATL